MTKKIKKNLQDSKNSSIFAPKFITYWNYTPVIEHCSSVPATTVVPNEAMSVLEMLQRTERGQRINVHQRMRTENFPDNMYPESEVEKLSETIHDTPPDDMNDIVDVLNYQQELAELQEQRKNHKQTVANAGKSGTHTSENGEEEKVPGASKEKEAKRPPTE